LRGHASGDLGVATLATTDKGAQPVAIAPHQHRQAANQKAPQQDFQAFGDVFEGVAVEVAQKYQPSWKFAVTPCCVFSGGFVFAKAIAGEVS
jgi:hypothetical protein